MFSKAVCTPSHDKTRPIFSVDQEPVCRSFTGFFCQLGGVVGLSLAFRTQGWGRPRLKSVDIPDTENQLRPCGMIIRHEKAP
ncbi:hypothetical protein TNCV_1187061 [Trichonephila clavipes]|nr:hypothetical protein TNCV_1187061 [Trichonephila clavipes]